MNLKATACRPALREFLLMTGEGETGRAQQGASRSFLNLSEIEDVALDKRSCFTEIQLHVIL